MKPPSTPRYKCHKEVWALKIGQVQSASMPAFSRPTCKGCFALGSACGNCERCDWERKTGGRPPYVIVPADPALPSFGVSAEYVQKHSPKPGGYYVAYDDGYESYSPAEAFEQGYTRL